MSWHVGSDSLGVNAHVSPRLSKSFCLSIERLLKAGLTIKAILQNHMDEVVLKFRKDHPDEDESGKWSHDMQLTAKDGQTIWEAWRRRQADYTNDDATTMKIWVHRNPDLVHIYCENQKDTNTPFMLMWATEWQVKKLATLGHGSALALDATFGTNQYSVCSLHIFCFNVEKIVTSCHRQHHFLEDHLFCSHIIIECSNVNCPIS